jgi:hypothetical protein
MPDARAFLLRWRARRRPHAYCVAPAKPDTGKKWPFWQWLLVAAWAAAFWAVAGPAFVRLPN